MYEGDIRIVIVYVREAHPGQMQWRDVKQPSTKEERLKLAQRVRKELDITITIAVTEMNDTVYRGLGGRPNSAILVGKGRTVLYKEAWANPAAWPPLFDKLLTHMDENDGEQLELGVGERTSPRGSRGAIPERTHVPKDAESDEDGGDGAETPEGEAEGGDAETPEGDSEGGAEGDPEATPETPEGDGSTTPETPDDPDDGLEDFR